jgi:hypothetical protein
MTSLSCSSSSSAHYPFKAHESEEKACVICQSEFPDKQLEELDLAQRVTKCAIPSLEETRTHEASVGLDLAEPVKFIEPIHNFHSVDSKGNQEDHRAHLNCAKQWLKVRSICPCCNEKVNNPWAPKPPVLRTTNGEIIALPHQNTWIKDKVLGWSSALQLSQNLIKDVCDDIERVSYDIERVNYEDVTISQKDFKDAIESKSNPIWARMFDEGRLLDTMRYVKIDLNQEIIDLTNLTNLDETSERVRDTLIKTAEKGLQSISRLLNFKSNNDLDLINLIRKTLELHKKFNVKKVDYLNGKFAEMKDSMMHMNSIEEDHIDSLRLESMGQKLKELMQDKEDLIAQYLPFEKRRCNIDQLILEDAVNEAIHKNEMSPQTKQSLDSIKDNISQIRLLETELNTKIEIVKRRQNERILAQENAETRRRNQTIAGYALVSLIALGCTYFDI